MLALVTSDIHGYMRIFERYSELLRNGPYAIGIVVGDILDDGFKPGDFEEAIAGTDLHPDDFLPELAGADEDLSEYAVRQLRSLHSVDSPFMRAMSNIEGKVKAVLNRSGKPVYVVPGNHDQTRWTTDRGVINVDGRREEYGPINLVGYRWTTLDRRDRDQRRDLRKLGRFVDENTILVTHSPPYGTLDDVQNEETGTVHFGSKPVKRLVARRSPAIVLCGHVHRRFGRLQNVINCAFPASRQFVAVDLTRGTSEPVDSGIPAGFWK